LADSYQEYALHVDEVVHGDDVVHDDGDEVAHGENCIFLLKQGLEFDAHDVGEQLGPQGLEFQG